MAPPLDPHHPGPCIPHLGGSCSRAPVWPLHSPRGKESAGRGPGTPPLLARPQKLLPPSLGWLQRPHRPRPRVHLLQDRGCCRCGNSWAWMAVCRDMKLGVCPKHVRPWIQKGVGLGEKGEGPSTCTLSWGYKYRRGASDAFKLLNNPWAC